VSLRITDSTPGGHLLLAIMGVFLGSVLLLGSFPFLWWNEGRLDVSTIAKKAVVVAPDGAGGQGEGQVISVTGGLATDEVVGDPDFLAPKVHVALRRRAEMYAWIEEQKTEERLQSNGKREKVTTYESKLVWTDEPKPSGHGFENPPMAVTSTWFFAPHARVGSFQLAPKDAELPPPTRLSLSDDALVPLSPHPRAELAKLHPRRDRSYVYLGEGSPDHPTLGDVRVSFESVDPTPGPVTLYGVRKGDSVTAWVEPDKLVPARLYRVVPGTHEQAIALLHGEHTMTSWILRVVGFLAMWIGLTLLIGPLNAVLDMVPFVGQASRLMTTVVMFPLALALSTITILLGILAHHPLWLAVPLLVGAGVFAVVRMQRKNAAVRAASPAR
jgi:hypothetical protein